MHRYRNQDHILDPMSFCLDQLHNLLLLLYTLMHRYQTINLLRKPQVNLRWKKNNRILIHMGYMSIFLMRKLFQLGTL